MREVSRDARLIASVCGLYASFLLWGYLQERLSSTDYRLTNSGGSDTAASFKLAGYEVSKWNYEPARWNFVFVLNCCMALVCFVISLPFVYLNIGRSDTAETCGSSISNLSPTPGLALAALSNAIASPFGYLSLRYINYPMLLLIKSSKLVPVMLLSYLINGKRYSSAQMASVAFISLGVALFSCKAHPSSLLFGANEKTATSDDGTNKTLIGLALGTMNLLIDGYTNARQDKYSDAHKKGTSFEMMYQMNLWQFIYMAAYLVVEAALYTMEISSYSQLKSAMQFMKQYPAVVKDLILFSLCGASGQIFVFYIVTSFGSLMCVLITVTRKFFSILLSVLAFGHRVQWWQWLGVGAVFAGLMANTADKYINRNVGRDVTKKKSE